MVTTYPGSKLGGELEPLIIKSISTKIQKKKKIRTMRYLIEAFDKVTDLQVFVIELPHGCEDKLKTIMQWSEEQHGWEGYNLTPAQLTAIETLAGRVINDSIHHFQLTCNV